MSPSTDFAKKTIEQLDELLDEFEQLSGRSKYDDLHGLHPVPGSGSTATRDRCVVRRELKGTFSLRPWPPSGMALPAVRPALALGALPVGGRRALFGAAAVFLKVARRATRMRIASWKTHFKGPTQKSLTSVVARGRTATLAVAHVLPGLLTEAPFSM